MPVILAPADPALEFDATELLQNAVADTVYQPPSPKAAPSALGMSQVPAWIAYDRKVCALTITHPFWDC